MGSLAWFIFITLIVIGVQAYIYGKWGLTGITYKRSFSERAVFAGEEIEMVDELVNEKILPLPWVRLESRISHHLEFIDEDLQGRGDLHRRSEEHTSELQSRFDLVCRLL